MEMIILTLTSHRKKKKRPVTLSPCVLCPCLTQVANDCWKFLFCWNVTGVPIFEDSTTLAVGVPWPEIEPTMTLGVAAGVAVVPVGVALTDPGFCSRRFYANQTKYSNSDTKQTPDTSAHMLK